MTSPRFSPLWLRLAWPVALFVGVGSIVLALWLHASARREERNVFARLAQTNAEFIRTAQLPASDAVAESIGRGLGMQVFFRLGAWDMALGRGGRMKMRQGVELIPGPRGELLASEAVLRELTPREGIARLSGPFEAIAVGVNEEVTMLVVRRVEPPLGFLTRPQTILILGTFWLLSIGLAWALAAGLVRPLRLLAERLPKIENDLEKTLPGAERTDEIGLLARAYLKTRTQLAEERARREKSERLALLGKMATGLAHEIHNPLTSIRMHAQLIDSTPDAELGPAARASLPVLLGETARIEGLVNQWMFLARPAPPQTAVTDLSEIVASVVRAQQPEAAHAGVELRNGTGSGLLARVDARRMAQAIGNVVRNAIQAQSRGGFVVIEGSRGEVVRLSFRDGGPGFSVKALTQHAELFYSEKEGGMGIGLSVASEILRAHGGSLRVANAPEGGAIVTFLLPAENLPATSV